MGPGVSISFLSMTARKQAMVKVNDSAPGRDDRGLWRNAVHSVTPLRGRAVAVVPGSGPTPTATEEKQAKQQVQPPALERFSGIDRANAERLKARLEEQLPQEPTPSEPPPSPAWTNIMFRLGRGVKETIAPPPSPKGDWTDHAFRLGRMLRGLKK